MTLPLLQKRALGAYLELENTASYAAWQCLPDAGHTRHPYLSDGNIGSGTSKH